MNETQSSLTIMTPLLQYGFAGMCIILIGIIIWLISKLLGVLEKTNNIIAENTKAIILVDQRTIESFALLVVCKDKLISRPCIAKFEQQD
jgi:hypothetical protein